MKQFIFEGKVISTKSVRFLEISNSQIRVENEHFNKVLIIIKNNYHWLTQKKARVFKGEHYKIHIRSIRFLKSPHSPV